jgi:hypothetical protein
VTPVMVVRALTLGAFVLVVSLSVALGPIAFVIRLLVGDTGIS